MHLLSAGLICLLLCWDADGLRGALIPPGRRSIFSSRRLLLHLLFTGLICLLLCRDADGLRCVPISPVKRRKFSSGCLLSRL